MRRRRRDIVTEEERRGKSERRRKKKDLSGAREATTVFVPSFCFRRRRRGRACKSEKEVEERPEGCFSSSFSFLFSLFPLFASDGGRPCLCRRHARRGGEVTFFS